MKKIFAASAFIIIIFLILFLTGTVDFNNTIIKSLLEGNRFYMEEQYSEALASYQNGLQKDPQHQKLNYNAGQAAYALQSYQEAAGYYGKAVEKADTYLNWGNSLYMTGENTEDINQKLQFYVNALETYKQGIMKFPENIELKFNFEFVEEKIKSMQESMNQNQQKNENNDKNEEQQDNGQNNGNNEENQEEQQNGQQNEESESSGQNEQEQQENEENESSGQNEQNQQENNDQNNSGSEEQQNSETEQNNGQDGATSEETGSEEPKEQDMPGISETDDSKVGEEDSRIEHVLKMLEKQEEQALKNNQHIKDYDREDEYDW